MNWLVHYISHDTYNQISTARGFMNENNLVGLPLGILKRMEIPRFMKGLVKSITASLAKFMVKAPMAISACPAMSSGKDFRKKLRIYQGLIS